MLNAFRQYPPAHASYVGPSESIGFPNFWQKFHKKPQRKVKKFYQSNHKGDARFEILQSSRWGHPPVLKLELPDLDQIKKNITKRSSLMVGVNWGWIQGSNQGAKKISAFLSLNLFFHYYNSSQKIKTGGCPHPICCFEILQIWHSLILFETLGFLR
jgi:hypothetical protein